MAARPQLHRPGVPVIEIFGPTIQGEGPDAGRRAFFVRFGGCDYHCSWCDSLYAVEPDQVREHATRYTAGEIADQLLELGLASGDLVVLSGGNPALHDLSDLVADLHMMGAASSVETQGSVWKDWLGHVDRLVVSPKPPSSGMATDAHMRQTARFLNGALARRLPHQLPPALKIVVFDDEDLVWAADMLLDWPQCAWYLSAGTPTEGPPWDAQTWDTLADQWLQEQVRERYRWLCERVARLPELTGTVVLPQLHVIAWGTARGV